MMGYDHDHGRGGGGGTRNLEHIYIYTLVFHIVVFWYWYGIGIRTNSWPSLKLLRIPRGVQPCLYRCSEEWNSDYLGMFGGLGRLGYWDPHAHSDPDSI